MEVTSVQIWVSRLISVRVVNAAGAVFVGCETFVWFVFILCCVYGIYIWTQHRNYQNKWVTLALICTQINT